MNLSHEMRTEARSPRQIRFSKLFAFFIPLGISASLVTISHVIINSTLARAAQPEAVIASYAIALSLLGITEKPAALLRQTCSALVRDRVSFRAMSAIALYVFASIFALGLIISYTDLGRLVFRYFFGVQENGLQETIDAYRILMFVSIFSGIRCLYHGIIIFNKRTTWLTIGMIIRLVGMYALAQYYIMTGKVNSGSVGAVIFLLGMVIEAAVSVWEGRKLLKKVIPEKVEGHPISTKRQIFQFYRPLLYYSLLAVVVGPAINAMLGKSSNMELAIASYAIAFSLAQLAQSFFSYIHQIVLNFYRTDRTQVIRFTLMLSFIPALLVGMLAYTPVGPWFMENQMGVNEELMQASLEALRVFMIMNLIFPWLDFFNGIVMLRGQTKIMVWSQGSNVGVTLIVLLICIIAAPGWNGTIGALAQSLGFLMELAVVLLVLRRVSKEPERPLARG
ncbi:multi antimicrobial extrusion protein MatE [Paenibacillus sp. 32O-W]|uniref:multi antimicrobial extrusion protein MatE n=1 Tax=Paenibacillus sp. 32O-W TaxID=1695218 RepID=UPI0011A79AD2|nr:MULTISPECIES: multi antimicrobial extrusion protein MatE [Paenibacillaceae]